MGVLNWQKPAKSRSSKEHEEMHGSDTGIPGTYVPNMSEEDRLKWRAKYVGGIDPRVEIRKGVRGTNLSLNVRLKSKSIGIGWHARHRGQISLSLNGTGEFTIDEWQELLLAVTEARLHLLNKEGD